MQLSASLVAGVAALIVGVFIIWAKPNRRVNLLVGTCSLHGAVWLFLSYITRTVDVGLPWLRATTAVGALVPFHLWLVMRAIAGKELFANKKSKVAFLGWLLTCLALGVLCFTEYFIPARSTSENPVVGVGYFIYIGGLGVIYLLLLCLTYTTMRTLSGLPRLEMQVWMLGGGASALLIVGLMGARAVLGFSSNIQAIIVLTFFAYTAATIATHRIFDARHLVLIGSQRVILVGVVAVVVWFVFEFLSLVIPVLLAFGMATGFGLWWAVVVNTKLDRWFMRYPKDVEARAAAFAASQSEVRTDELREKFIGVLKGWGAAESAMILISEGEDFESNKLQLIGDDPLIRLIKEMEWVTPERLTRERENPHRLRLVALMRRHSLSCLILTSGPTLRLVVGVGVRPSRRPFTFPEINQLRELASIFESALSRTHLLAKAQRAEQLATVGLLGAGVAHEIRNPLVSIKAFVQLLPTHFNDQVFRERFTRIIGDEVERIDRLTEQLLDLAAPRNYSRASVDLHGVIKDALELVRTRAEGGKVHLVTALQAEPGVVLGDVAALKQVVMNLCFNAIQAQEGSERSRWVRVETRRLGGGEVQLTIADNGPGIPVAARAHLFEPFRSTKSSGFGLGLTVCSEILSNLGATISLDPPEADQGATFRVTLPCPPPSS